MELTGLNQNLTRTVTKNDSLHEFANDVLTGLSCDQKRIPSRYFYDKKGSELFNKITETPEYYLTNCENEILENSAPDITKQIISNTENSEKIRIVELGAGDCKKIYPLLDSFYKNIPEFEYNAIDISPSALANLSRNIRKDFSNLTFKGIAGEYTAAIKDLGRENSTRNLILLLGSNIGNFSNTGAKRFLYEIRNSMNEGDWILIGFDLIKEKDILMNAYNDSWGITSEFNLNLLIRMNRELGSNFNLLNFSHLPVFNAEKERMESYLLSHENQTVFFKNLNCSFHFKKGEVIHTEFSQKYDSNSIHELCVSSGFSVVTEYTDSNQYFVNSLWRSV